MFYNINSKFPDLKILPIGNKGDYENVIVKLIHKCKYLQSTGITTVNEASNLMRFSLVSIVYDCGALLIGGAVNSNMIALIGPTDPSRFLPFNKNIRVIKSENAV